MAKDRKDARQKKKGGAVRGTSYKRGKTAVPDGKSYRRFNVGDRLESSNSRNPVVSTVTTTDYEDYLNNFGGSRRSAGRTDRPRRNDARARTRGSDFRGGRSGRGGTETDAPGSQIKDVVKRQLPKKQVRITASVITAIIAGLLVYHIFQGVYVDYKTEVVTISPYLETIDVEGIAIRDEQIVSGSMSSTSVMTVKNGDKISTGETIVNIFPSESEAEAFERAAEIDAELEKLRNMIAVSENNVKTVNLINRQLDKKMVGLNKAAEQRNMGEAAKIKSEIGYLMNKQLVAMRQTEGFDARIELLEKEREELDSRFSKDPRTITSPGSGYFADSCDGYENLLNSSMTGTLTVDQLKEIMNREVKPPEKSIGKLVNSFTWYLACPVPSIDSDYLIVGAIYTLYLPYSDNESIEAVLYRLDKQDGQDTFLAVFRCNSLASELCAVRRQPVRIVKCSYEGFAIPKSALHAGVRDVTIKNPHPESDFPRAHMVYVTKTTYPSVYAIVAGQIREKEVNILYGTDKAVICSPKYSGQYLSLGDTVVIKERGLYNGKLIG